VHHLIADITGVTGTAIVEAIIAGQRDPAHLASLRDKRLRADVLTLTRALTGDYRAEHLFCLQQAYAGYQFVRTQIVAVEGVGRYRRMASTIDDALGEAFDKTAKLLGLPYPGGPHLARLAESGDPTSFELPRPMLHSGNLDFSFAGLKTAVRTHLVRLGWLDRPDLLAAPEAQPVLANLAASTQAAIVEVLVKKVLLALKSTGLKRVVVAGGVGANRLLRSHLDQACTRRQIRVHYPEMHLCTDNGAMIALAAAMRIQSDAAKLSTEPSFDVKPRWDLSSI